MVRTYILFFPPHINANIYMSLLRVVHVLLCPFLTYKKCCRIFYFFLALVASGTAQPPKVERATATCTMMEPTASAPGSLVVLKPCSSCKQQLQPKDMTSTQKADECKGTTDQWRCKPCGQVVSRISRRGYDQEQKKTIADFSPTSRVKFMKESQSLFGPDLDKKVHETSINSRLRKQASVFAAEGDYVDIDGEDGVKETMKNKPEDLKALLENSRTFFCPVFQKHKIWVPKYSMKLTDENVDTEERKRKIDAEFTIKKAKKIKAPKAEPAITGDAENADNKVDDAGPPMAPIAAGQVTRLQKSIPKLEDIQLNFVSVLGECSAPDNEGLVGQKAMQKAHDDLKALQGMIQQCKHLEQHQSSPKGAMKPFFNEMVATMGKAQKQLGFLRNAIDMD